MRALTLRSVLLRLLCLAAVCACANAEPQLPTKMENGSRQLNSTNEDEMEKTNVKGEMRKMNVSHEVAHEVVDMFNLPWPLDWGVTTPPWEHSFPYLQHGSTRWRLHKWLELNWKAILIFVPQWLRMQVVSLAHHLVCAVLGAMCWLSVRSRSHRSSTPCDSYEDIDCYENIERMRPEHDWNAVLVKCGYRPSSDWSQAQARLELSLRVLFLHLSQPCIFFFLFYIYGEACFKSSSTMGCCMSVLAIREALYAIAVLMCAALHPGWLLYNPCDIWFALLQNGQKLVNQEEWSTEMDITRWSIEELLQGKVGLLSPNNCNHVKTAVQTSLVHIFAPEAFIAFGLMSDVDTAMLAQSTLHICFLGIGSAALSMLIGPSEAWRTPLVLGWCLQMAPVVALMLPFWVLSRVPTLTPRLQCMRCLAKCEMVLFFILACLAAVLVLLYIGQCLM